VGGALEPARAHRAVGGANGEGGGRVGGMNVHLWRKVNREPFLAVGWSSARTKVLITC